MADPGHEIWSAILAHLRQHHVGLCRRWFDDVEPLGVDRGALILRIDKEVHRRYLERECASAFSEAAQAVTGMLLSVRFLSADTTNPNGSPRTDAPAQHLASDNALNNAQPRHQAHRRAESLAVSPDYTFDSFVIGPENRLAHATATAISNQPGRVYNPVFLHGGVGLGKTHLLQAICQRILDANPAAVIHYLSCEEFITQFMESIADGQMAGFRHRFRDADVLVIDDIHFLTTRDRTQEEFFHTFNSLYQANKQIVLSSDAPPDQIPDLEQRLVSRFKWGMVAELMPPGYETRVAIVRKKAELRAITIPDDVAECIADRVDSNIRELEGALLRIQMIATVEKRPLDLELANKVFGDRNDTPARQIQIAAITAAVTDFYSVKLTDLQSKRRHKSISLPRQVCMYLARRHTAHSLEEIGAHFGGRDHTTVMHAVKTVAAKADKDENLRGVLKALEKTVLAGPR